MSLITPSISTSLITPQTPTIYLITPQILTTLISDPTNPIFSYQTYKKTRIILH